MDDRYKSFKAAATVRNRRQCSSIDFNNSIAEHLTDRRRHHPR
jgi:hypothetical protein